MKMRTIRIPMDRKSNNNNNNNDDDGKGNDNGNDKLARAPTGYFKVT